MLNLQVGSVGMYSVFPEALSREANTGEGRYQDWLLPGLVSPSKDMGRTTGKERKASGRGPQGKVEGLVAWKSAPPALFAQSPPILPGLLRVHLLQATCPDSSVHLLSL